MWAYTRNSRLKITRTDAMKDRGKGTAAHSHSGQHARAQTRNSLVGSLHSLGRNARQGAARREYCGATQHGTATAQSSSERHVIEQQRTAQHEAAQANYYCGLCARQQPGWELRTSTAGAGDNCAQRCTAAHSDAQRRTAAHSGAQRRTAAHDGADASTGTRDRYTYTRRLGTAPRC